MWSFSGNASKPVMRLVRVGFGAAVDGSHKRGSPPIADSLADIATPWCHAHVDTAEAPFTHGFMVAFCRSCLRPSCHLRRGSRANRTTVEEHSGHCDTPRRDRAPNTCSYRPPPTNGECMHGRHCPLTPLPDLCGRSRSCR